MRLTDNSLILMIEDDPGHAYLMQKNLRRAGLLGNIKTISNGLDAQNFLFESNLSAETGDAPLSLVLLDLNLPGLDGFQILKKMRNHPKTKLVPVFVISTTDDPKEVHACYNLGCNAYLTKPVDYTQFSDAIQKLGMFIKLLQIPNSMN